MINLRNFNAAMEGFSMEDGEEKITIEQVVEIEEAADAETEEVVEVEETIDESEDVADETAEMLATLEYAAHTEAMVEEFGWSRPVAAMLNKGQDVSNGRLGDIEMFLGITMPSNESLDMVSSSYDDNTVVAMEGFKKAMEDFWKWIKKQCAKIRDFFIRLWDRIVNFFRNSVKASKRYAEAIDKATIDQKKLNDKEAKLVPAGAFSGMGSVVLKASEAANRLTSAIRQQAASLGRGNEGTTDTWYDIGRTDLEFAAAAINLVKKESVTISDDGTLKITAGKSDYREGFKAEKKSVGGNGWNAKSAGGNSWKIVADCDKIAQNIKANKTFINSIKTMQDLEVRHARATEDKDLKKGAREHLKGIQTLQKFLNMLAKIMSYAIRQFIRGQRAVLACRA